MFQFETRGAAPTTVLPDLPARTAAPGARAFLSFAEHCVECAAPACYAACGLYDPSPSGACRRFDYGIRPVTAGGRTWADVRFRKWGKLEARGSAAAIPAARIGRWERGLSRAAPMLDRVGAALAPLLGERWRRIAGHLQERVRQRFGRDARHGTAPDSFFAEIYNPGAASITLLLGIEIDQLHLPRAVPMADQPRPFRRAIVAAPGLTTVRVPGDAFAPIVTSGLPFLVHLSVEGDRAAHVLFGALDFEWDRESAAEPLARAIDPRRPPAKCVVFDLDDTLWDGVLLEGEVTVRAGVEDLFRELDARGILLSVASKNAPADALARLEEAGLREYLLHPQIGWEPKSAALARIAAALDIGIDSVMFVDDNPFERAEIAAALPAVEVLPDSALASLADHPRLQGAVTAESRGRRALYRTAAAREAAAQTFDDYAAFLRDCAIAVDIRPHRPGDLTRIAELAQRTNQLNFSGRKYDADAIRQVLADPASEGFVITVRDRFGSYGLAGFCLAQRAGDTVRVREFMLSCRVQGRFVEQAVFDLLTREHAGTAPARLEITFHATERNAAARRVLETLGFERRDGMFVRDVAPGELGVDFLRVNEGPSAEAD
jgi:FkbH-like protein